MIKVEKMLKEIENVIKNKCKDRDFLLDLIEDFNKSNSEEDQIYYEG